MTPELRFPGFEGEWAELQGRDAFSQGVDRGNPSLPVWSVTMDRGLVPRNTLDRHMEADAAWDQNRRAAPGDLVYNTMRMWQGAVGEATEDCMLSPAYVVLRPTDGAHPSFFLRMFETSRALHDLGRYSHGLTSDRLRLYYDDFGDIPFSAPGVEEQRKIAAFLDAVGERIALAERRRYGLVDYKRGLMQALFTRRLRFRRDDGSAFPEWTEHRLGELVSFLKGRGVGKDDIALDGAQACIRYGEIYTTYGERITQIASRTEASPDLLLSEAGDIIMPSSGEDAGDMARACAVMLGDVALGGDIIVLRGAAVPVFLAHYLTHARRGEIARLGQGNSVVHIYAVHLGEIEVDLPHPDEQAKIADALIALDDRIRAANARLNALLEWRRGLLQKMFVR